MTKAELVAEIVKVMGPGNANRPHLMKKTPAELRETLARWRAITGVSRAEMDRHCDTSFLYR